ncbi:MAG: hypothetical protein ABI692_03510 [Terracoccus sp.]
MEGLGYIERIPDPADRRSQRLRLTPKAHDVRRAAMAASRRIDRALRADLGDEDVAAMRRALTQLLERHDALDDAVASRSRAVW